MLPKRPEWGTGTVESPAPEGVRIVRSAGLQGQMPIDQAPVPRGVLLNFGRTGVI
ncbi:hypothetical protein ACP26L_09560 [Paenibacillus sp. S-38]|uniref:hypothetical protein n=1 Tax=Paenibacillus sp. S-38 TaxID=3416710 RepID=UPI003CEAD29D